MARILIVLRILWTAGAQRIAINEYKWLKRLGHDPKIVFLRAEKTRGYEDLLRDVEYRVIRHGHGILTPVFYIPTKLFSPDRGIESTVDLDLIMKVPEIAREEGAEYLICHDQFAGIGCYQAHRKLGLPYSVFIHEKVVKFSKPVIGKVVNDLERKVLANAKRVFAVTEKVAKTVYEKHGIEAVTNYPGMDKVSDRPFSEREDMLLSVSFWDLGRRPWDYLDVIEKVDGYKLILAGNWRVKTAKEKFLGMVKERKLEDRVELREGLSEGELSELYSRSRFFIRFGFGEFGLATSVVEAIQHTTPLIINDELGTADLVRGHGLGLVIRWPDVESIKEFMHRTTEREYAEIQARIREIQKLYSWESHSRKLVEGIVG